MDTVPPPPFRLMGVVGDLCVARRRRCPCMTSFSLLDLPWQAPSANVTVFMERDTKPSSFLKTPLTARTRNPATPVSGFWLLVFQFMFLDAVESG